MPNEQVISPQNPVNSIPPPAFKANGKPVVPRVWDVTTARAIHKGAWDADAQNRLFRAWIQAMLDGKSPWDEVKMKSAGLGGCCNIDWGYGKLCIRKKLVPYVEALNSMQTFLSIRTKHGSRSDRIAWGRIMSEKHYALLKYHWRPFIFRYLYNVLYLSSHGVGFCYFNDNIDWRWNVSTMGQMVVDRLAKADASEFSHISTYRDYLPHELYDYIAHCPKGTEWTDPDKGEGWHVPTVRQKLENATDKDFFRANDWELNEREWKNLELYYARSGKVCPCIFELVPEVDGTVTQLIMSENAMQPKRGKEEQFLFKQSGVFKDMNAGIVVFSRDIGTNGDFQSIRGLGNDIFQVVQMMNKLQCRTYDAVNWEMSVPVRATEERLSSEDLYVFAGPVRLMQEGVTEEPRGNANYSRSAFPAMQMFRQDLMDINGGGPPQEQPGSKMDLEGLLERFSGIDVMEATLFFLPWQTLLQESLRRMIAITSVEEPGGELALKFRQMCYDEGVPKEAIDEIMVESCIATRPIGNGSPQAHFAAMSTVKEMMSYMDAEGRYAAARDFCFSVPGMPSEKVEDYFPPKPDMRPGQEVRNATYENFILTHGGESPVLPNDDPIIHLEIHIPEMEKFVKAREQGVAESVLVVPLLPLWLHANEHEEKAEDDEIMAKKIGELKKGLQELGEIITNGSRQLDAQKEKHQANPQSTEKQDSQPDPAKMVKFQEAMIRLKMARSQMQHQEYMQAMEKEHKATDLQNKKMKAVQERQIRDVQAALTIAP